MSVVQETVIIQFDHSWLMLARGTTANRGCPVLEGWERMEGRCVWD